MNCPECRRSYADPRQRFCVDDGVRLTAPAAATPALRVAEIRPTAELGKLVAGR